MGHFGWGGWEMGAGSTIEGGLAQGLGQLAADSPRNQDAPGEFFSGMQFQKLNGEKPAPAPPAAGQPK